MPTTTLLFYLNLSLFLSDIHVSAQQAGQSKLPQASFCARKGTCHKHGDLTFPGSTKPLQKNLEIYC